MTLNIESIESKDDLMLLLDYFSSPPRRLNDKIDNYSEYEKIMREACKRFNVEIPYWLKED